MASKLRFQDGRVRIFVDGEELGVLRVISFDSRSDMQVESNKYMGDTKSTKDATDNGDSLTITVHRLGGSADPDEIFDRYRDAVNARGADADVRIVHSYKVPGQSSRVGYRYEGCQLNVSVRAAENRPYEFTFTAEAESRVRL